MIQSLQIAIQTPDKHFDFDVLGSRRISAGDSVEVAPGARLVWQGSIGYKAFGEPSWATYLLEIAGAVPAGVIAAWLYHKLKGRALRMTIDRTEVEIEEGEIKKVIQERIDIEESP